MRLEQLFHQLDHALTGSTLWDARIAIQGLVDIQTVFSRNDLKSEILKELDRHTHLLSRIGSHAEIDQEKLNSLLQRLQEISRELYTSSGKIGLSLIENDFFKSISQRSTIPGGTCAFDLPEYYFWLTRSDAERRRDLTEWLRPFSMVRQSIDLILTLIRQSSAPTQEVAKAAFFQETLDRNLPYQLLRVGVSPDNVCFAEISGGKHRFTVRFMTLVASERVTQATDDIIFQLTRCLF